MITGRQTPLPAGGRASFRSKSLVLFGILLILGSMFAFVAARPESALAVGAADPTKSTIAAGSLTPSVDTGTVITVQAKDSTSANLTTGGDIVTITSPSRAT